MEGELSAKRSAEALKARSRKWVTLPEAGVAVLIRKLIPRDFVAGIAAATRGLDIPAGSIVAEPGETDERARARARARAMMDDPKVLDALGEVVFGKGVLAPRILLDSEAVAGDGEVNAWDVPESDLRWLLLEIIEFSGLGREARAVESFREGEAANDGVTGSPGETIREDAS